MENKYYLLGNSFDPSVVGISDGGSQAQIVRDGFADKRFYDSYFDFFANRGPGVWSRLDKLANFEFQLQCVRLRQGAKLTDMLSYYPEALRAILVSPQTVELFSNYKLPTYKGYTATVFYPESPQTTEYIFLSIPALGYEVIDFKNTTFFMGDEFEGKEYFDIETPEDFETKRSRSAFSIETISLTKEFDGGLDLFTTKISSQFFVSERLKCAIKTSGLTGFGFLKTKGQRSLNLMQS